MIPIASAQAERRGVTWSLGAGGAYVRAFDRGVNEPGYGFLSLAGSLGGFVSPRASFAGRVETTLARTAAGRGIFVVTVGPTAEVWATDRLLVGFGMAALVIGIEPYDILISRGLAIPLRASVRPFAGAGLRITLGLAPALFRERAVVLHTTLLAEWQGW